MTKSGQKHGQIKKNKKIPSDINPSKGIERYGFSFQGLLFSQDTEPCPVFHSFDYEK